MSVERPVQQLDASWVELDAAAMANNLRFFWSRLGSSSAPELGVVLKGNAYGHGLEQMGRLLARHEAVRVVFVFNWREVVLLRPLIGPKRRIVVIGPLPDFASVGSQAASTEWVVSSEQHLQPVLRFACGLSRDESKRESSLLRLHLHVDTGLGREGFSPPQAVAAASRIADAPNCALVGVMTHFANTEDVTQQDYAHRQRSIFEKVADDIEAILKQKGQKRPQRHLAATAASLLVPESRADLIRVGIGLFGLWPSTVARLSDLILAGKEGGPRQGRKAAPDEPSTLLPVLSWRVRSQCVKTLDPGDFVGYGCTFRCEKATRIAVFPVGYFDGYVRHLTSRAYVLVQGRRCPVVGRVMMNHIVVDVTAVVPPQTTAVVATLIGSDGEENLSADCLAEWSGTINYEVVTRIGSHLKRIVIGEDK